MSHLRLTAVGHSDQTLIAARNRAVFADNYALSRARAEVVAKYLVERLSIDPARVTVEGHGADEPLAHGSRPREPRAQSSRRHRHRRSARRRRRRPHGEDRGCRRAGRDRGNARLADDRRARRLPRAPRPRPTAKRERRHRDSCSRRTAWLAAGRGRDSCRSRASIVDPASAGAAVELLHQRRSRQPAQLRRRRDQRSRRP